MNPPTFFRFLVVSSFFLAFTHCARLSLNEVAVVGRNFGDEVQQTQNLTFTFNKNLSKDAQLNQWDMTEYVRFKPAVRGKFKWTALNELVFSPTEAFDPATDYRAELTKDVLKNGVDKDLKIASDEIAFHTPYLQLTGVETWWAKSRENGQPIAKSRLNFNYAISPAEVSGKVTMVANDKPVATQAAQSGAGSAVNLTLADAPAEKNEQPLVVKVDKGLKVLNTGYQSKDVIEKTTTLPSRYRIEIADVQTGSPGDINSGTQRTVRVITTQELQPGNLKTYYTIQPQVETTAELTENGFTIRGNFNEADTYVLTLTDQIRGVLNTRLEEPVTRDLFFGQMPASLSFANKKAIYLSSKGAKNVGLNVINVPKVQVKIAKVYENNILQFLKTGRYEDYSESGDGEYGPTGKYTYTADGENQYSDVLVDKTVETGDLPKVQGVSVLNVALPDQSNAFRGVYLVSVGSEEQAYVSATQLVSVSDIGLIARQTDDNVLVFANSIRTAEPLKDVEITLVSSNNQSLYTLKTDGSGTAKFEKVSEKAPGFSVVLLTARTGTPDRPDDFNFLYLPDTQVETSRFEVDGKRVNASGFEAFIYGDRNIYRPGETVHFNTIIRNQTWQSVGEVPVLIRVLMPNGREYGTFRKTTNGEGAITTDVPLDLAAVTGSYTIEVLNANDVLLASESISVEEFIPDRIKVDALTDKAFYQSGQTITLSATALNLFGPPAADRAYEIELQLKRKVFAPKGFSAYNFSIPGGAAGAPTAFEKVLRQGRTNANGQVTELFPVAAAYQDIGIIEGKLYVTVFDENGRPVNRLRRVDVLTQTTFFGVRLADTYVTTNSPLAVDVVALTKDGALRNGASATVEVVRFDYQTVIEKKKGSNDEQTQINYTTKRREKIVYTNTLTFGKGQAAFKYVPTVSGEYEVRVRRPAGSNASATGYTSASFYAYGYGSTSASSFEVSSEGQVLMEFDKTAYETGDKAKVLFKAPFNGKMLVTVERNRVMEHHWLTTDNKSAELSFSLGEEHLPTVYVTATLIRALDNTNLPLTVAHGFAPVAVSGEDSKLPVAITAVAQSRSKTKQVIRVKTKANSQVTIAVVDEGILQLKNFVTPDPHAYFYQKRALEVGSHDLYALLFPELSLSASSTGGDGGFDLEKRVNPLTNGRVKLVTFWSGILDTGFDGEAEFTVDVPQFSGDLRVMAVAYKNNGFGSASTNIKVADPIVISAGLPRFLTPGDELELPVNLSNTTKKGISAAVKLTSTGPLEIVTDSTSGATQQLTIQPGRETRTTFRVRAKQAIGPGAITVTASGLGETFVDKTEITVRPAASLVKTTQSGVIAGGKIQTLTFATDYLPGTGRTSLSVSRSPAMQFGRELSFLLGYPYGCLEQTISKAFPQLYFADLTKSIGAATNTYFVRAGDSDLNPATNVRQAIQRVESGQLYNGSFAMWPGLSEGLAAQGDDWATAYAVHFLVEAQQAGYEVNPAMLSKTIDYLTAKTNANTTEDDYVFDESGGRTVRKIASRTNIYSLYALSLMGRPNRPAMSYYKANAGLLTTDSRYLLASTFFRIGDTRSYQALVPKRFADNTAGRQNGGSYASPLRNLSLTLLTLLDTDPGNGQIPGLARQLATGLKQSGYLNTQEAAYGFLALGKLARKTSASTATATISAGGKTVGAFTGTDLTIKRVPLGLPVTVSAKGSGNLYYFAQSEGIPTSGTVAEGDNGLQVRRTFLGRNGEPLSTFRQNDLIVVRITLSSSMNVPVDNIVITDLLPASFEIENPRLTEAREMPWIKNLTTGTPDRPDYFDVRDDRINFFTSAGMAERTFYYQVRAVSKGTFVLGPVSADAMYSADYRSYSGAGRIRVE